jgi:hypothetical protein
MTRRDANILIGLGIPAGIMLVIFFFGIFFGGAWGYGGGDMPPTAPNPNKGFFQDVMWCGGIGMAIGALLSLTSLVALIFRLISGPKNST